MFKRLTLVPALMVAAGVFYSAPAAAQSTRTWVSGVGDDANPCSRTAPCKTFAGAISKTGAGGEINCLDPGGFAAVTITKSISIVCDEVLGSVLAASTNGITINGAGISVTISGIEMEGVRNTFVQGLDGIKILQANRVVIVNTRIRGFINGINVASNTSNPVHLFVANVQILGSGTAPSSGSGITLAPQASNAVVYAQIADTHILDGYGTGIAINTTGFSGGKIVATVSNSVVSGNGSGIVSKTPAATGTSTLTVVGTVVTNNSVYGVFVNGAATTAQFSGNTITGNGTGFAVAAAPTVTTYGDNVLKLNTIDGAFPSPPVAKQ